MFRYNIINISDISILKIDQVLEEKNISKNKLEKGTNPYRMQLNSYCNNNG